MGDSELCTIKFKNHSILPPFYLNWQLDILNTSARGVMTLKWLRLQHRYFLWAISPHKTNLISFVSLELWLNEIPVAMFNISWFEPQIKYTSSHSFTAHIFMYLNRTEQDALEEHTSSRNANLSKPELCGKGLIWSIFSVAKALRNRFQLLRASHFNIFNMQVAVFLAWKKIFKL